MYMTYSVRMPINKKILILIIATEEWKGCSHTSFLALNSKSGNLGMGRGLKEVP